MPWRWYRRGTGPSDETASFTALRAEFSKAAFSKMPLPCPPRMTKVHKHAPLATPWPRAVEPAIIPVPTSRPPPWQPSASAGIIPRRFVSVRRDTLAATASAQLLEAARANAQGALTALQTQQAGLTQEEADSRLVKYGPNALAKEQGGTRFHLLLKALLNPLVLLLTALAILSYLTGDIRAAVVMALDGGPRRGPALHSGGASRHGRRQAQGHDPRHRDRPARWRTCASSRWPSSCPATSSSSPPAT